MLFIKALSVLSGDEVLVYGLVRCLTIDGKICVRLAKFIVFKLSNIMEKFSNRLGDRFLQ